MIRRTEAVVENTRILLIGLRRLEYADSGG
jgi:hypothetical protein